jgi:hypothetical protein
MGARGAGAPLIALLVLWGALGRPAQATTLRVMSEAERVRTADVIAVVEVIGSRSQWIRRRLVTLVELRVSDAIKGKPGSSLTLLLPGGVDLARGLASVVDGVPRMTDGQTMLLFAVSSRVRPGTYLPVGLTQGMVMLGAGSGSGLAQVRTRIGVLAAGAREQAR